MSFRSSALVVGLGIALASSLSASTRLTAGLPFSDVQLSPTPPRLSADGRFAIFRYDAVIDGSDELWSVELPGGDLVRLSDPLEPNQTVRFTPTAASDRVIYLVDQDVRGRPELWSVPIRGGASVKLNPALPAGRQVFTFAVSPTGNRIAFAADLDDQLKFDLWSAPVNGGGATRISPDHGSNRTIPELAVSADGAWVVYRMGRTVQNDWELWSVPIAGGEARRISRAAVSGGSVDRTFRLSPDGSRAVYLADALADETQDLWSVPVAGGSSIKLTPALPEAGGAVTDFVITSSGRALYRADVNGIGIYELWSSPLDSPEPVRLSAALPPGRAVETGFAASPNGERAVYLADQNADGVVELFSVPIRGGTPVRLNGELTASGDVVRFAISPNGARVVYLADETVEGRFELFSVPIAGGTPTRVSRVPVSGGDVLSFQIGSTSEWIVYGGDVQTDSVDELFRVPLAGGISRRINGPLPGGGDVVLTYLGEPAYRISEANGTDVLYVADETTNDQFDLYLSDPPGAAGCITGGDTLCLQNGRFQVTVDWTDFAGATGAGQATALSNESGDFWFFDPASNEMIVKILDACGVNGNYWVSWRALSNVAMTLSIRDVVTDQEVVYRNPLGYATNGHLDIETIFRCDGSGPASETYDTRADLPAPGVPRVSETRAIQEIGPCAPNGDAALCLQNDRFRVSATFRDFAGNAGAAHFVPKNDSSGYAWFFGAENYELLFKLIDGCSLNGRFWVFAAGLTNVEAELRIVDRWTGRIYVQSTVLGEEFPTNLDIETAFDDCGLVAP